ncbi:MAG TPA: DUF485 domain-containing protein [Candidatus Baltobacteraceae bacterium]|jgi:uncharacterized membrane protein (DUF485 family)
MEHHHLSPGDWESIQADPAFRQLVAMKRRFIVPATIFFLVYYFALPILVGFAPALMERQAIGHLNAAYVFALSQFAMAWILLALYLQRARKFDFMEAQIVRRVRSEFR